MIPLDNIKPNWLKAFLSCSFEKSWKKNSVYYMNSQNVMGFTYFNRIGRSFLQGIKLLTKF
jgi:hypothetical protein